MISDNILNTIKKSNTLCATSKALYEFVGRGENSYLESYSYINGELKSEIRNSLDSTKSGGVIIFPINQKINGMDKEEYNDYLKKEIKTYQNYLFTQKNIETILDFSDDISCSMGNLFNGGYHSINEKSFNERSFCIEFKNMSFDDVLKIAENICSILSKNDMLLVSDYSSYKMVLVDNK